MYSIYETLIYTPWWVYLLFCYLVFIGIKATKTRVISLKKLFALPIIFSILSIETLVSSFKLSVLSISIYAIALSIGLILGWLLVKNQEMQFDKKYNLIQVQGSWSTLILILCIFCAKYYFGYALALDPNKSQDTLFEVIMLVVSGAITGMFIGRLLFYLYKKKISSHTDLKK